MRRQLQLTSHVFEFLQMRRQQARSLHPHRLAMFSNASDAGNGEVVWSHIVNYRRHVKLLEDSPVVHFETVREKISAGNWTTMKMLLWLPQDTLDMSSIGDGLEPHW
jgi:hypothetical protein